MQATLTDRPLIKLFVIAVFSAGVVFTLIWLAYAHQRKSQAYIQLQNLGAEIDGYPHIKRVWFPGPIEKSDGSNVLKKEDMSLIGWLGVIDVFDVSNVPVTPEAKLLITTHSRSQVGLDGYSLELSEDEE